MTSSFKELMKLWDNDLQNKVDVLVNNPNFVFFFKKDKDILVNVQNTVLFVTTSKSFDVETIVSQNKYLTSFDGKQSKQILKWFENIEVTLYKRGWVQIYPKYEEGIELLKGHELYGDTHRDDVFLFLEKYGQLSGTIDPSFFLGENWD